MKQCLFAFFILFSATSFSQTPSWDATLTVNDSTAQTLKQGQTKALGSGSEWFEWSLKKDVSDPKGNPYPKYTMGMDDAFTDGSGNRDQVFQWHGYNYPIGGYTPISGEAAYSFRAERFYTNGMGNLFEFHIPEIKTTGGTLCRLQSIYANRDNGTTLFNYIGNTFNYFTATDQTDVWNSLVINSTGGVSQTFDASFGTGGYGGTKANIAGFYLKDGSATQGGMFMQSGILKIQSPVEIEMLGGANYLVAPSDITYTDGTTPPHAGDVYFTGSGKTGHGYKFFNSDQSVNSLNLLDNGATTVVPWSFNMPASTTAGILVSNTSNNATTSSSYTQVNFKNGTTPNGTILSTASNYNGGSFPLAANSMTLYAYNGGGSGELLLGALDANGYIDIMTGGTASSNIAQRIQANGNITAGSTTDASTAKLQVTSTSQAQASFLYDATHHTDITTASTGNVTIAPSGKTATINGQLEFSGTTPTYHSGSKGTNVTSITVTGTDAAMHVVIVTSGAVSGTIGSIDYSTGFSAAPHVFAGCYSNSTGNAAIPIVAAATSSTLLVLTGVFSGAGTYAYDILSIK